MLSVNILALFQQWLELQFTTNNMRSIIDEKFYRRINNIKKNSKIHNNKE